MKILKTLHVARGMAQKWQAFATFRSIPSIREDDSLSGNEKFTHIEEIPDAVDQRLEYQALRSVDDKISYLAEVLGLEGENATNNSVD